MNAQQVWQAQAIDAPRISLSYVRHVASDFDRRRRQRAARGYVMYIGVCGLHAFMAWQFFHRRPLLVAASVCFVAAVLYWAWRLHRHVAAESSPADAGVLDTLRYQRRQFERQRDWRRGSWRWTFLSVLPGYALMLASMYFEIAPVPWISMGFTVLVLLAGIGVSAWDGDRRARHSQREIDVLDSLASDRDVGGPDGG